MPSWLSADECSHQPRGAAPPLAAILQTWDRTFPARRPASTEANSPRAAAFQVGTLVAIERNRKRLTQAALGKQVGLDRVAIRPTSSSGGATTGMPLPDMKLSLDTQLR